MFILDGPTIVGVLVFAKNLLVLIVHNFPNVEGAIIEEPLSSSLSGACRESGSQMIAPSDGKK